MSKQAATAAWCGCCELGRGGVRDGRRCGGAVSPDGEPSIAVSILLFVVGVLAIVAPFFAGVSVSLFLGWLILLGGLAQLVYAWSKRGVGAVLWQVLMALVYFVAAYYLLARPISGVVTLTLILAFYIATQGVIKLVTWAQMRKEHGAGWFLTNGLVSLLVAGLILSIGHRARRGLWERLWGSAF